jgi:hypothetical protein
MIQGVGDWLLVMLIYFGDGTGIIAAKRFETQVLCQDEALEVAVRSAAAHAALANYRCTELHGADAGAVAASISQELYQDPVPDENSVPGY